MYIYTCEEESLLPEVPLNDCRNPSIVHVYAGLLGIDPLPNNGTAGSLYHLLAPSLLPTLPPPQALQGTPGIIDSCPYLVSDDNGTLSRQSFCKEGVCRLAEQMMC